MNRRRADGEGIADRLAYACALTQILFDEANAPAGAARVERRRDTARRLLDAGADATAIFTGSAHAPAMVNAAWRALLGDAARALPLAGLPATTAGAVDEVVRTGERAYAVDLELRAGERICYGTAVFEPLRGPRGTIDGAIVAAATERRGRRCRGPARAGRAGRSDAGLANRRTEQLLATVSHELRGTLSTMQLWAGVLRDDALDAELRRHALDALHQSVLLQSRLMADLLDVSRAVGGVLHIDRRALALSDVLVAALAAIAPSMADKRIALETDLDPALGFVMGDALRLRQVLDDLLANALRFTEPNGRVVVTSWREVHGLAIAIADDRRGIARSSGGHGLGLAIASQLVTLHGGTLEAASFGGELGATFTIRLPAMAERRAPERPAKSSASSLAGIRVLVIDDDPHVRDAFALLLTRSGAIVETADSARSARQLVARARFDAWVCDIAMPGEDGYELVRMLRAGGDSTPAIALTAHGTAADAERARDAGFDLHAAKPIELDRLIAGIQTVVAAHASGG